MFSKEESKRLRQEFWVAFGKSYPRKWILYNTKIKGLALKFSFGLKKATVSIDLELDNLERRIVLWEKLISLKSLLIDATNEDLVFDDTYVLENQKEISRIYVQKLNVSIHDKNSWQVTMQFLNENMHKLELFFEDYKEIIAV